MKLVLVVGPSGSGKDTLLRAAQEHFRASLEFGFAPRYITRPPDDNENNYYVDPTCFQFLKENNFFLSQWRAHGNQYGIPRHILLNATLHKRLLCSISRGAINDFEEVHDDVTVLNITAETAILRNRLQTRGREHGEDIEKRLQRAVLPVKAKHLITFDNSGSLEQAKKAFLSLLEKV